MKACPYCGSTNVVLNKDGFYVCARCGSIIEREYDYSRGYILDEKLPRINSFVKLDTIYVMKSQSNQELNPTILFMDTYLSPCRIFETSRAKERKLKKPKFLLCSYIAYVSCCLIDRYGSCCRKVDDLRDFVHEIYDDDDFHEMFKFYTSALLRRFDFPIVRTVNFDTIKRFLNLPKTR